MIKTVVSTATRLALAPARLTTHATATLWRELRGDSAPSASPTPTEKTVQPRTRAKARPKRSTSSSRRKAQPRQGAVRTRPKRQPAREPAVQGAATAPASGFPEEPALHQEGDRSGDPSPHHALNNPVADPDPTEWPDPYEHREDPLDPSDPGEPLSAGAPHAATGATSTSQPHPSQDPEAEPTEGPKRDRIDD